MTVPIATMTTPLSPMDVAGGRKVSCKKSKKSLISARDRNGSMAHSGAAVCSVYLIHAI